MRKRARFSVQTTRSSEDALSEKTKRGGAKGHVVRGGIGFGSALAIVISWSLHQSILWAMIHGVFSWFYVIYYALTR